LRKSFSGKQIKARVSVAARNTKISVTNSPIRTEFEPDILKRLPQLSHVHPAEQLALLRAKIEYCSNMYSFKNKDQETERYRKHKSQTFIELTGLAKNSPMIMNESIRGDFVDMLHKNIVLPIPDYNEDMEEEIYKEPQFEHIGFALNLFAMILNNRHFKSSQMKSIITQNVISDFFQQMHHPDERIRESLKTVLHQIYTNFIVHRGYIRREISNYLLEFLYESDSYRGIPQIMQILGSIVSGFSVPLKAEHKVLLIKILIPLHCSRKYAHFSSGLSFIMLQYMQKEPELTATIVDGIIRAWPMQSAAKEIELLDEVEEILSCCEADEFTGFCASLFRCLAKRMSSQHYQVAERSLYFLNKPYIIELIAENLGRILPQILPDLIVAAESHWNSTIVLLVCDILRSLNELDTELFTKLIDEIMKSDDSDSPRRSTARKTIARASLRASDMQRRETLAMDAQPNAR